MKDIHSERPSSGPIPLLSPIVHCVSLTALVFLRRSFGFVFLRPKSIFFAVSWALILFDVVAWNEPALWRSYYAVCAFGSAASLLYWMHLVIAFSREIYRVGEHDLFSGKSHSLLFAQMLGIDGAKAEKHLHLWGEPFLVLLCALTLRFVFGEHSLATWLVFAAACMSFNEATNYWAAVRREKVKQDVMDDTREQGDVLPSDGLAQEPPKQTRKEPVKRQRNFRKQ